MYSLKRLSLSLIVLGLCTNLLLAHTPFNDIVVNMGTMGSNSCDPGVLVFTSDEDDPSLDVYKMNPDGSGKMNVSNDYGVPSMEPSISGDGWRIPYYGGIPHNAAVMCTLHDGSYHQKIIPGGNAVSPDISPKFPRLAYVVVSGEQLRICNLDGSEDIEITNGSWPDWSPDGSMIVYVKWSSGSKGQIWIYDLEEETDTMLTPGYSALDVQPEWSPDGSKILFTRKSGSFYHVWIMDAEGSNQKQLTFGSSDEQSPSWSPDGSQIAFTRDGDIWIMDADGTSQVNITNTPWNEAEVDWGPGPCPAGFTLTEDFDSVDPWTSVSDLPGWSSHDGSGIYGSDAMIISDVTVTTTPPNHMRVHGLGKDVSAMRHINSPDPIIGLNFKFDYELQSNANGKVEISSSPGGGWFELGPLVVQNDNIINDTFQSDLTGILQALGVFRDVYIRWSSNTGTSTWAVFNIDTVEVKVDTLPSKLRYGSPSMGVGGCESSIGMLGDVKIGDYFSVFLAGALENSFGYLLLGLDSQRDTIPFGTGLLLFSPIVYFYPVSQVTNGTENMCNWSHKTWPILIPSDPFLADHKLSFQYLLVDPGGSGTPDGPAVYTTAGLEVFIK